MTKGHAVEQCFFDACVEAGVKYDDKEALRGFLAPLRVNGSSAYPHYLHSLRVGLLSRAIGEFTHHEGRPLLLAGALHDLGKCQVALDVLGKSEGWTARDAKAIQRHVMDGYRMLSGRFDFSAAIILWHHRFQADGYPKKLPKHLHVYAESSKLLIVEYGRIIALADVYDALHRANDKFGAKQELSGEEVRAKMFELNPDRKKLIAALYDSGIFTV